MVDLSVEICGLKFRNPILPGAGLTVRDGDALVRAAEGGAGGLVTRTVSVAPAQAPRPCLAKVRDSLLSAELWTDLPLEQWLKHEYQKVKRTKLPLIASIGYKPEEIRSIAPKVRAAGANAIELSTRQSGNDPSFISEVTKAAKEVVDIPVFVKLSPNVQDIAHLALAAERSGADGVVAVDAFGPCLSIDIENAMPMLGSRFGYGWLSGPAIKPLALRCVADICRSVRIPVIGAGGISDWQDAVEFIMVGASAVQISTAAIIRGPKIYGLIADEMARFMRIKGYNSIADFRGIALRHLPEQPLRMKPKPPEILVSRCNGCGLCEQYCPYKAMRIAGKVAQVDPARCYGCGLCVSLCPTRGARF